VTLLIGLAASVFTAFFVSGHLRDRHFAATLPEHVSI
jgi:hypothetical protein